MSKYTDTQLPPVSRFPWISLPLAILQGVAGLLLLVVSSWFICASAVAGVNFNYMLPAVGVRALALLRISSGYFHLYFGHSHLLKLAAKLRLRLFAELTDKRLAQRSWLTEALAKHVEQIAGIWVSWVAQQATAVMSLLVAMILTLLVPLPGFEYTVLLALAWLVYFAALLYVGVRLAAQQVLAEQQYRYASEHALNASAIWHLEATSEGQPACLTDLKADKVWDIQLKQRKYTELGVWLFQLETIGLLAIMLLTLESEWYGNALLIIVPMLLLTAPDWLSRSLQVQPAMGQFKQAKQALTNLEVIDVPSFALDERITTLACQELLVAGSQAMDMQLAPGLVHTLTGPSGAGKSRFLQGLAGHLPHSGERSVNGQVLPQGLCRNIAYVEQQPQILNATVVENLHLAAPEASNEALRAVLDQVGLETLQLVEWLGVQGRDLSGGERKRFALARVLLANKDVVLLDEPFEGLDLARQQAMAELINQLAAEKIVLVATHIKPANLHSGSAYHLT